MMYQTYLNDHALDTDKEKIRLELYKSKYAAGIELEKIPACIDEYAASKDIDARLKIEALILKGKTLAKIGEIDKAIHEFLMLKENYPGYKEYPEASFFVGYCYMLQGKFNQAEETFNLVINEYPQSAFADQAKQCLTRIESMTGE